MKYLLLLLFCISQNANALPDGNPGDHLITNGIGLIAWAAPSSFIPGNETIYSESSASVGSSSFVEFWDSSPDRTNISLGDSADIIFRTSASLIKIVNAGLHTVDISFTVNNDRTFALEINNVEWARCEAEDSENSDDFSCHMHFTYNFAADDEIRVQNRSSSASTTFHNISVTRLSI